MRRHSDAPGMNRGIVYYTNFDSAGQGSGSPEDSINPYTILIIP
jgi:hypothetical protein